MKCPVDGTTLTMSDRQGIEIDYCPQCRGVWLDRGELDKIIDRSTSAPPASPSPGDARIDVEPHKPRKKSKSAGFLSDLFEFGG
jgi:Zn-finger nucleic acid-binding protein